MHFISAWERASGEELHCVNAFEQPLEGPSPVWWLSRLVQWFHDETHSLSFPKHQVFERLQNAVFENSFYNLSHLKLVLLYRAGL